MENGRENWIGLVYIKSDVKRLHSLMWWNFSFPKLLPGWFCDILSKLVYLNFSSLAFQSSIYLGFSEKNVSTCFNNAFFFFSAFICHHNCFLVYGSLEEPTVAKWSCIIHVSTLVSVFISILFATCGYLTFTGFTQGKMRGVVRLYVGIHVVVLSLPNLGAITPHVLLQWITMSSTYFLL